MSNDPGYVDTVHDEPDQWHRHTAEEGMPQDEHGARVNPLWLAGVLVATIIFVAIFVGVVQIYFESTVSSVRAEKTETVDSWYEFEEQFAEDRAVLTSYGIADAEARTAHIPIDLAMEKIVERYQR